MTSTTSKTVPVDEVAEWSGGCVVEGADVVWSGSAWFGSTEAPRVGAGWIRRDVSPVVDGVRSLERGELTLEIGALDLANYPSDIARLDKAGEGRPGTGATGLHAGAATPASKGSRIGETWLLRLIRAAGMALPLSVERLMHRQEGQMVVMEYRHLVSPRRPRSSSEEAVMTVVIEPMSAIVAEVRALDGDYFLCAEVAAALRVSKATLRRLGGEDGPTLGPTHRVAVGAKVIALYSLEDVERIRTHLGLRWPAHPHGRPRRRPGRHRVWSDGERLERQQRHCAASRHRARAHRLASAGDLTGACAARLRADEITDALRREYVARYPSATAPVRAMCYDEEETLA